MSGTRMELWNIEPGIMNATEQKVAEAQKLFPALERSPPDETFPDKAYGVKTVVFRGEQMKT